MAPTASFTKLRKAIDEAAAPFYFLNADQTLCFANQALADWLETNVEAILGRTVAYHAEAGPGHTPGVAAGLCPPPEAFAGQVGVGQVSVQRRDGRLAYRAARFWPIVTDDGGTGGVLVLLATEDATREQLAAVEPPSSHQIASAALHAAVAEFHRSQPTSSLPLVLAGQSPAIAKARRQVALAASRPCCALVTGPEGAGLIDVARTMHQLADPEGQAAWHVVDAAVVDRDLLTERLATIAAEISPQAAAPTVVVQHGECLPSDLQVVLAEWYTDARVPVRLVLLQREVSPDFAFGTAQAEVTGQIVEMAVHVPRLCERTEDLPLLLQAVVEEQNARRGRDVSGIAAAAQQRLLAYHWPGDLRELRQLIEHSHAVTAGPAIGEEDLPPSLAQAELAILSGEPSPIDLDQFLADVERELIARAMHLASDNKTQAARLLGLNRPRLYRRLEQLGWAGADSSPDQEAET